MHRAAKINDALHFLEPKRSKSCMRHDIFKQRIRGKLGTTFCPRPLLDTGDKGTRDTHTLHGGL